MRAAVSEISSKSVRVSSSRLSTKNAWAKYVRNRWPNNALKGCMAEWSLTEGEARGLVYAQVSQTTIDKIMDREDARVVCGGFALGLEILAIRTSTTLEQYIAEKAEEARREGREWEERERRLASMQARLAERGRLDWFGPEPDRSGRAGDGDVGAERDGPDVARRSFEPRRGSRR